MNEGTPKPTGETTEKTPSKNALTRGQFFRVCEAVKGMRHEIAAEKLNAAMVAARVGKEVDFPVTRSNVVSAARALDIKLFRRFTSRKGSRRPVQRATGLNPGGGSYLAPIRNRVEALEKAVAALSRDVNNIMDGLGLK